MVNVSTHICCLKANASKCSECVLEVAPPHLKWAVSLHAKGTFNADLCVMSSDIIKVGFQLLISTSHSYFFSFAHNF